MVATFGFIQIEPVEAATIKRTVNFDVQQTDNGKMQDMRTGTVIDDQWENWGLDIDATRNGEAQSLTLFDTDCSGKSCSGGDSDLATGDKYGTESQGNVLIIQENNKMKDGLFTNPDDHAKGGTVSFDFSNNPDSNVYEDLVQLNTIALLDLDDKASGFPTLTAYYLNDDGQEAMKTLTLSDYEKGNEGVTLVSDNPGDNSMWEFDFGGLNNVMRLDVSLPSSGAVAYLEYEQYEQAPTQEVPEPGVALGLLALGAFGGTSALKRHSN